MIALKSLLTTSLTALTWLLAVGLAAPVSDSADNSIGDIINLLELGLITHIETIITLESLVDNLVSVNFDVKNPLILELTLDRVVSQAGLNGTVYASFDQSFTDPVVVPILGSANSGTFGNVTLVQGATASLNIIPFGVLDIINADVYARVATIDGALGIPIAITGLKQSNVNTTYELDLDGST